MSATVIVVLVAVGWIAFGPALAIVMGRRGHAAATWGLTGTFLGPLAAPIALAAARRRHNTHLSVLNQGRAGTGPLSVLAGIDGSEESRAALGRAVELLGDRIGRLTLVHVASVDAGDDDVLMNREKAAARAWFAAVHDELGGTPAAEWIVAGHPAKTLADLANRGGYDMLVVGNRGRGMSPRLLGSVVAALTRSAPVTVLVGGPPDRRHSATKAAHGSLAVSVPLTAESFGEQN